MASPEDARQLYKYADISDPRLNPQTLDSHSNYLQLTWPGVQEALVAQRVAYDETIEQNDDAIFASQGDNDFLIREATQEDAAYNLIDNTGELLDVLTIELARGIASPGPVADCAALTLFNESGTCVLVNSEGAVLHDDNKIVIAGAEDASNQDPLFPLLAAGFSRALHYPVQPHNTTGLPTILDAAKEHDVIGMRTHRGFVPILSILNANHEVSRILVADAIAAAALDEQRKQ